jgi:hypothetical protein
MTGLLPSCPLMYPKRLEMALLGSTPNFRKCGLSGPSHINA